MVNKVLVPVVGSAIRVVEVRTVVAWFLYAIEFLSHSLLASSLRVTNRVVGPLD